MYLKKCGKKILELLAMCMVVFLVGAFSCERVYAEETVNENGSVEETAEFNAPLYLMALLDNSYKNDSTLLVLTGIATAEEAAEIYKQGIDAELAGMDTMLSAEGMEEYRKLFADLFAGVKYTVGSAEKQADGSYVVTVVYEPMNVFEPAMESYIGAVYAYIDILMTAQELPSDDEMMEWLAMALKNCLEESLKSVTYGEPQATTVKISLDDNGWTPSEDDVMHLEEVLFDIDDARAVLY